MLGELAGVTTHLSRTQLAATLLLEMVEMVLVEGSYELPGAD